MEEGGRGRIPKSSIGTPLVLARVCGRYREGWKGTGCARFSVDCIHGSHLGDEHVKLHAVEVKTSVQVILKELEATPP